MNSTALDNKIQREMNNWSKEEYSNMVRYLARLCTVNTKHVSCISIYPGEKPGYQCGFVFFGPPIKGKEPMLGEIRWDERGRCTDFLVYEDKIMEVRDYVARRRAERARAKSVNRSHEQAKEREISLGKELSGFVKRNVKKILATAALSAVVVSSVVSMGNTLNPDYLNNSYRAGYNAVSYETHRTSDNEGYWYDYRDIALMYDDQYDFDSWVYGAYNNVGWNKQSKLDCMDDLFYQLELVGVTEYDSFLEYCDSKGVCVEKDGKLVIDTKEFTEVIKDYMRSLKDKTASIDENKKSGFRI